MTVIVTVERDGREPGLLPVERQDLAAAVQRAIEEVLASGGDFQVRTITVGVRERRYGLEELRRR